MAYTVNVAEDLVELMFLYKRYVGGIIVICEWEDDINCLLNKLNVLQNCISLLCEEEKNDQLPFLDILISRREDGSIERSIFRKPTWTGQYLSYYSYCSVQYKRGLIRGPLNRINSIYTKDDIDDDVRLLNKTPMENGYPLKFITRWEGGGIVRPIIAVAQKCMSTSPYRLEVI